MTTMLYATAAASTAVSPGPAPNSGDGIPDGSGFGEEGGIEIGCPNADSSAKGPAPNSGDGIPDGSGF